MRRSSSYDRGTVETTKTGRPRSEEARQAIHEALLRIVVGRGYGALTMDGLAAEAGVGKQTLYRWWPSRAAVMLEALRHLASAHIPVPDSGSLRRELARFPGGDVRAHRPIFRICPSIVHS